MIAACGDGDLSATVACVEAGADVDAMPDGVTALHAAIAARSLGVVRYLVERADTNAATADGRTPLHLAARVGSDRIVSLLLNHDARPDAADASGRTPLMVAAERASPAVVAELLAAGATMDARDRMGRTALSGACAERRWDVVKILLRSAAAPNAVRMADANGATPLIEAADSAPDEIIEALLAKGADPNAVAQPGTTPLLEAVMGGNLAAAQVLIAAGANARFADDRSDTVLHHAAGLPSKEMLKVLLRHTRAAADVGSANGNRRTPLHLAAMHLRWRNIVQLLKAGASPDAVDGAGLTPRDYARTLSPPGPPTGDATDINYVTDHFVNWDVWTKGPPGPREAVDQSDYDPWLSD